MPKHDLWSKSHIEKLSKRRSNQKSNGRYYCPECAALFYFEDKYKEHYKEVHTAVKKEIKWRTVNSLELESDKI